MSHVNCFADEENYGDLIVPGFSLVRFVNVRNGYMVEDRWPLTEGAWGLTLTNDPSFIFDIAPCKVYSDKEVEALPEEEFLKMITTIDHYVTRCNGDANICYFLVSQACKVGYDQQKDGFIGNWIMDRLANFLETKPIPFKRLVRYES